MTESLIKNQICQYLALRKDVAVFWIQQTGKLPGNPVFSRSKYIPKGISDILGCLTNGRILAIEVKTAKGIASVEQDSFIQKIRDAGGLAFVARSVEDVKHMLEY